MIGHSREKATNRLNVYSHISVLKYHTDRLLSNIYIYIYIHIAKLEKLPLSLFSDMQKIQHASVIELANLNNALFIFEHLHGGHVSAMNKVSLWAHLEVGGCVTDRGGSGLYH